MTTIGDKVAHVRRASTGDPGDHHCHWTGCTERVPPAKWGCKKHWFMLPKDLRDEIWRTYRPGQEVSKTPSPAYVIAALKVRDWIAGYLAQQPKQENLL